jgi:sugar phosphate isomerase/epimerase
MLTRRDFGVLMGAGLVGVRLPAGALRAMARPRHSSDQSNRSEGGKADTTQGVHIGVQTYSFRDLPRPAGAPDSVDLVIKAIKDSGVSECELFAPQLEPAQPAAGRGARGAPPSPESVKARDDLRTWRLETPLDHFTAVRKKFDAAGLTIYAYCLNINNSFTDAEIDRGFQIARALGTAVMTTSTTLDVAKRIAPIADKHQIVVGLHGHSNISDPNELATPESFATALKMSPNFRINLDIGHFTAANYDPVAYIREHHAKITNLHLKDRKKNQGDNVPWGQGDTPIREVLQLLKREKWPIPADIEYEYRGQGTPVEEVAKCVAFAKQALA